MALGFLAELFIAQVWNGHACIADAAGCRQWAPCAATPLPAAGASPAARCVYASFRRQMLNLHSILNPMGDLPGRPVALQPSKEVCLQRYTPAAVELLGYLRRHWQTDPAQGPSGLHSCALLPPA